MKKFFAFLTFCCLPVHVYAGTITGSACGDDCTWHLDDGVLTVVGSGRINEYQRECTDMGCTTDAPWFPRRLATSIILRQTIVGCCISRIWSRSDMCRRRLEASTTTTIASGRSRRIKSRATRSSGDVELRLYIPGRSTTSIRRSPS